MAEADHDLLNAADALATALPEMPLLADLPSHDGPANLPVLVDRQLDRESEVNREIGKALGATVLIGLEGWNEVDAEDDVVVTLDLRHSISLWTIPVLRDGLLPTSQLLGRLLLSMAAYCPQQVDVPGMCCRSRWKRQRGLFMPHKDFLIYEFSASVEVELMAE